MFLVYSYRQLLPFYYSIIILIDIRKGGIAYVQYLKIPPGDGGLISIRGLSLASRSYIFAAGLSPAAFFIGETDYNSST